MTPAEVEDELRRRGRLMLAQADALLGIDELNPQVELDAFDAGVMAGVAMTCHLFGHKPADLVAALS